MLKKPQWNTITDEELFLILREILKGTRKSIKPYFKFVKYRNATMVWLSYMLGLRPKECRCIKMSDFKGNKLIIPPENNKQRNKDIIPLPNIIYEKIFKYIDYKINFFPNSIYLFPKRDLKPLDRGSHIRFFRDAFKRAGLNNLTLYSLRHSFGTNAYLKIRDIPKVAVLLRHYDFQCRTTLRYIHTASPVMREELLNQLYN